MKFKFTLEKVLKHKKILQGEAHKDFVEISSKLAEQEQFLVDLEVDLKKAYEDKHAVTLMGGEVARHLSYFHEFYLMQKKLIEQQKRIITGLEKIVEDKRLRLVDAAREKKIFEKLKEKRKQEFKKQLDKKEQKRIDEVNIIRYDTAHNPNQGEV
jgi:flagellar FliJ protein